VDFVLASIYVLYYIYRFAYVEPSLHPWDEADLVVVNNFLIGCWIMFAMILLRIFALMYIQGTENMCFYPDYFPCSGYLAIYLCALKY
jgi:hypothetical protein